MSNALRLNQAQLEAIVARHNPRKVGRMSGELKKPMPSAAAKPSKYRNQRVEFAGMRFASKKERSRYRDLMLLQLGGRIRDLKRQVPFDLVVNGRKIARYIADFVYYDIKADKEQVVDVKGYKGGPAYAMFRLKSKLMRACLGITVEEV